MNRFWEVAKVLERCTYWWSFIGRGLHDGMHASEDDFCEVKKVCVSCRERCRQRDIKYSWSCVTQLR
jgi:hypothetical protein